MLEKLNPYIRYARIQKLTDISKKLCIGHDNRLFVCLDGEVKAKVGANVAVGKTEPQKFEHFDLSKGVALFINAYTPYCFYGYKAEDNIEMLVLNFDLTDRFSNFSDSHCTIEYSLWDGVKTYNAPLLPLLERAKVFDGTQNVIGQLTRITEMFRGQEPENFYRDFSSAYLKAALISMLCKESTAKPATVRKALEHIRKNFRSEISNEEIAREVGYHPCHLNRLFKKHLGTGLRDYIISLRIREAKNKLAETDLSVAFIASECGFSDVSYFSQCFKRRVGSTPMEYRNNNRLV